MKKIAISTTSFGKHDASCMDSCRSAGYSVSCNPYGRKITPDELIELAHDAVGLIAGTELLSKDVLVRLPLLKVISRCGVGIDNIDLDAAHHGGIQIFNTPDAPTQAVAELTIGLMLASLRHIAKTDRLMRAGTWHKSMGNLLANKVVGIIGFGRIGQAVLKLCLAFGADVIAYDTHPPLESPGAAMVSLNELITRSDIITLHVSSKKSQSCIITAHEIDKMKTQSHLINTSRGGLIDEEALFNALQSKKISGAALDTFTEEPYAGKLLGLDNIILTAHIGSYAKEARITMEKQAVQNLLKGLEVEKL